MPIRIRLKLVLVRFTVAIIGVLSLAVMTSARTSSAADRHHRLLAPGSWSAGSEITVTVACGRRRSVMGSCSPTHRDD